MINGGYKIINLLDKNLSIDGDAVNIPGIYDSVENNYRKVLLLSGIVIDGIEKPDAFVTFTNNAGNYETTFENVKITISNDDNITISNV